MLSFAEVGALNNKAEMAEGAPPPASATRRYLRRGAIGLLIGVVAGVLSGVIVVILLVGWGDYTRSIVDNRPAGIVSGSGTEAGFTRLATFVFAFWGAVVCGALGLIAGLFTTRGNGRRPGGVGPRAGGGDTVR